MTFIRGFHTRPVFNCDYSPSSFLCEATRSRIFDPFFTTKFTGRGLGLSSVLGIIRGHNGLITIDSNPGAGTRFRVFFPVSKAGVAEERPPTVEIRGSGTVLVVDDEEIVRRMSRAALQRLGFKVLTAANGSEALRIYAEQHEAIDIVLLDMIMPVMGGEETLERLLELRPDAKVLAMSGFHEREAKDRFGSGIAGFVQKPFTEINLPHRSCGASRRLARSWPHISGRAVIRTKPAANYYNEAHWKKFTVNYR